MTVNTIYNHSKHRVFWALNEENQQFFNFADFLILQLFKKNLELIITFLISMQKSTEQQLSRPTPR
jgi:hypothetical protein